MGQITDSPKGLTSLATRAYVRSPYFDQFRRYGDNCYNTTAEGLRATPTVKVTSNSFCTFCGAPAHAIQANIDRFNDYSTTGYFCDCSDAATWLEVQDKIAEMEKRHAFELHALGYELPRPSPEITAVDGLGYDAGQVLMRLLSPHKETS